MSRPEPRKSRRPARRQNGRPLVLERLESRELMDANSSAFVTKVFQDLLGRTPEPSVLSYLSQVVDSGVPRTAVVQAVESSNEYLTDFTYSAYQTFLNRTPDPTGLANALQLLSTTGQQQLILGAWIGASEFLADMEVPPGTTPNDAFLKAVYADFLGRPLDASAKAAFEAQLAAGVSHQQDFHRSITAGKAAPLS